MGETAKASNAHGQEAHDDAKCPGWERLWLNRYPLVNERSIAVENHHFLIGKSTIKSNFPFIALLNCRGAYAQIANVIGEKDFLVVDL